MIMCASRGDSTFLPWRGDISDGINELRTYVLGTLPCLHCATNGHSCTLTLIRNAGSRVRGDNCYSTYIPSWAGVYEKLDNFQVRFVFPLHICNRVHVTLLCRVEYYLPTHTQTRAVVIYLCTTYVPGLLCCLFRLLDISILARICTLLYSFRVSGAMILHYAV